MGRHFGGRREAALRVLIVSGIWPPDVGGPASHAPEFADYLIGSGHPVEAVVTADQPPGPRPYPVLWVSRRLPPGVRHLAMTRAISSRARQADVVYAAGGIYGRVALARLLGRRPCAVKLTDDPAFERAFRRGLWAGGLDGFGEAHGLAVRQLRWLRTASLRRADAVLCPSAHFLDLAAGWGLDKRRLHLVQNAIPAASSRPRDELRAELAMSATTFVFAGRLTAQKTLERSVAAVARVPDIELWIAGEGPAQERLEELGAELGLGERLRFLGPLSRHRVGELLAAADGCLLSSAWENMPYLALEALAASTPVIALATGGITEIVRHRENGLVADTDEALTAALAEFAGHPGLREQLRAKAAASVAHLAADAVHARLSELLIQLADAGLQRRPRLEAETAPIPPSARSGP